MLERSDFLKSSDGIGSRMSPGLRTGILVGSLLVISVAFAILIINGGSTIGVILLGIILGLPLVWVCFSNPLYALIISVVLSYFIFVVRRITGIYDLPTGTVVDILLVVGALGILFKKSRTEQPVRNVISITFFVILAYLMLEVLNPNAYNIQAWLNLGLRTVVIRLAVFVIALHAFNSIASVKVFTGFCIAFALVAAVYGMYQQWVGLPDFDQKWVTADPVRYRLFFINGQMRKWSILGEVSSFGVIMAFTAVTTMILGLGPYKTRNRVLLFIASLCMIIGMAFSGTRTAYVMLPIGIVFYILLTIKDRRTIVFSMFAFVIGGGLFFGPFYGGTLSRIRTAFRPSEDASMQVREQNRDFIQPYMWSNPFGGGIGTVSQAGQQYHPGHPLAGFPPDSGYMHTVLETGSIGLLLTVWLYFITLVVGVKNYFRSRDPEIKNLYVAYMAAFFAITIGNIAQNAVSYPPADIITICILVLMFRLRFFDSKTISTANETN